MQRALHRGLSNHETVFSRLQETIFESGQMQAYCIGDTGIAKKGDRSVGVHRQYSGTLGKAGNCPVVVSLQYVVGISAQRTVADYRTRNRWRVQARHAKMRWQVERDYQDMKQELGFDGYEGRSWGGLHRHLARVALMLAFIALHLEGLSKWRWYVFRRGVAQVPILMLVSENTGKLSW